MSLRAHFERSGNWLFRKRGYLPLLLGAVLVPALAEFEFPGGTRLRDLRWELLCLAISLVGLGIRVAVIGYVPAGTAGRNTGDHIARQLNTSGLFAAVSSLTVRESIADAIRERRFEVDPMWATLFGGSAIAFMILRTLKHRTRLLHVDRS